VVFGYGSWHWMQNILKVNGYVVHLFQGLAKDIHHFFELIDQQNDNKLKSKYKRIVWTTITSIVVLLVCVLVRIVL